VPLHTIAVSDACCTPTYAQVYCFRMTLSIISGTLGDDACIDVLAGIRESASITAHTKRMVSHCATVDMQTWFTV
jgi:hypothetical protein